MKPVFYPFEKTSNIFGIDDVLISDALTSGLKSGVGGFISNIGSIFQNKSDVPQIQANVQALKNETAQMQANDIKALQNLQDSATQEIKKEQQKKWIIYGIAALVVIVTVVILVIIKRRK